jgi:hypothetical protein
MSRETPFVDFPAGSLMLREGEAAAALFIIEAGRAGIELNGEALAELGPGDVFGEAALLQEHGHATNAVARTNVRALRLDTATLPAVLRENVDVAMQLMRRLALRLRAAETRVGVGAAKPAGAPAAAQARPEPAAAVASAAPASAAVARAPAPATAPVVAAGAARRPAGDEIAVGASPPVRTAVPAISEKAPPATASMHVLRHAQGTIVVPAGKAECLVGRPDPATGAVPEINLGPLDLARSLSRRHARLLVVGSSVSLREEPGVANGTWVNGERLAAGQSVLLKSGDKLRFGAIELEFGTG